MSNETMPFKIAGADGKDVEVQIPMAAILDAVKDTHVQKDRVAADLDKRVQSIIKNQGLRKAEELLEDEAFVAQVLEKHGVKGGTSDDKAAAAKQLQDAIAKAIADVKEKQIKPLEEKLTAKETREQSLLVKDLERQIVQAAAAAGLKKSMLRPLGKGKPAAVVAMLSDMFAYDDETNEFYTSEDGENFVLSTDPNSGTTYETVAERIAKWIEDPANADFVDSTGQKGPGVSGTKGGKGGEPGVIFLTPEEAGNHRLWTEAVKKVGGDASKVRVKPSASEL